MLSGAAQAGAQGGGHLRQRHHDDGGGEDMSKEILSTEQLRALLKTFKEQHAEEYHLRALGYFGSYARNEATSESDIDVVFQTDHPDLFITAMLRQDLEAFLDHPVDVVRLRDAMNPRLKARIEREATYV
jgi:predicted nucleotidyltransferase